jgi:hypothetical protein
MSNLYLIDWRLVGFSALWILGLAVVLAALSYADYAAGQGRLRLRAVLARPHQQMAINAGLALFCLGLLGSARAWWESALWAVLAAAFAWQAWHAWRRRQTPL